MTLLTIPDSILSTDLADLLDAVESTQALTLLVDIAPAFVLPTGNARLIVEEQSWTTDASFNLRDVD